MLTNARIIGIGAGIGATASLATAAVLTYGARAPSSQLFAPSVYRGPGRRRSIALTFDDGPSPQSLALLDYLARSNIRCTFFQCGANILRHPTIARTISQAGHEIGNHTFSHARLCPRLSLRPNFLRPSTVQQQFHLAQEIIQTEIGVTPTLLRAPYGMRWFGMRQAQRELGLLGVMWTVIGHDWEWPAEAIADLVLKKSAPGGIICLHDGRDIQPNPDVSEMLTALQRIVPVLVDQGYRFETVSELLQADGPGQETTPLSVTRQG